MQLLKVRFIFILIFLSTLAKASGYYITTSDLKLRSGPGKEYSTLLVLEKGDTVLLLKDSGGYWVKIQYHGRIGYSAIQYLHPIVIAENIEDEKSSPFFSYFALLLILITLSIFLVIKGRIYRNKSTATFLSFFFGCFGFQKYYLGQPKKGVLSMLFCWTFIPTIIGIIDFIKLAITHEEEFHDQYNFGKEPQFITHRYSNKQVVSKEKNNSHSNHSNTSYKTKNEFKDESIIEIFSENLNLAVEKNTTQEGNQIEPPYWSKTYIYSYDEIKHASREQRKYYSYFKTNVQNGVYVNIQGNTNYAFILYFDFLNEYENHRDIKLLEEQFKLLGQICPKTKSYSLRSLQDELRKRSDSYSIDKLKDLEEPSSQFEYGYSDYNPDLYKLGNQYKEKLGLNVREIRWLNKFYNPSNVFTSIEGCCIATIMQYVTILKELNNRLKQNETTLAKEVTYFKEQLKSSYTYRYESGWNYYDSGFGNQAESEVYLTIFKRIENSVRETFGHKRKVSGELPNVPQKLSEEFETRLGSLLNGLIEEFKGNLGKPDLETQIELNAQNVNRWKIEFKELEEAYLNEEKNKFIDGITHLEETNKKNPNIENLFFEASKFISKFDKVQSLKYYAKYIFYDLNSKKFDNKELTKTVQKSLFKTEEQIIDFKNIISELIDSSDIQIAIDKIGKIYIPKRKKIKLDKSEIEKVEQKHEGTVELLNEYLVSEQEVIETLIENSGNEEIKVAIIPSETNHSIFISEISMGKAQEELVKQIVANSFEIQQDKVDEFATKNEMFKNQLIDSINEACEVFLDGEALIEEDDKKYIIEESYYKEIAK